MRFFENELTKHRSKTYFKYCYAFMKSNLSENGYLYLLGNIRSFKEVIENKEYFVDNETKDDVINTNALHELSGLDNTCIPELPQLKKAYLKKCAKVHPDKHPDSYEEYNENFQEVQKAYKQLVTHYYPKTIINNSTPDIS